MRLTTATRACETSRQFHGPSMALLVRALLATALTAACACAPTVLPHTLVDANGDPISMEEIENITSDTSLSDDEQREQLRELGITDESLIDLLVD